MFYMLLGLVIATVGVLYAFNILTKDDKVSFTNRSQTPS